MILHTYSLTQPNSPLTLKSQNSILQFKGNKIPRSLPVLYSTTEFFTDSDKARQMLSITYYPKYDTRIDVNQTSNFECVNNLGKKIDPQTDLKEFTRVWPAFGKTGGSYEFIITNPQTIKGVTCELLTGGAPDIWHQDTASNYDPLIAQLLAKGIIDVLTTTEEVSSAIPETYQMKQIGNGISANVSLKDKNITLSAAWKNLTSIPEFKFWACIWKDIEQIQSRIILQPYSEKVALCGEILPNCCVEHFREYLEKEIQNEGIIYYTLTETIRALLKKILIVTNEFFVSHSKKIFIPK